ncbi:BMP and activin membrane-bound inhibitor homolog isoform X2 [Temnothorax nylanderi]|uniref:BMP and activin membrane-bound inhibitor homolog isoform X2 n=1 Tax=Temnothorax nylanderi TaxID=102681 RepID=UPI003A855150
MLPRDVLTIAMVTLVTTALIVGVTSGAPTNFDPEDYEVLADNEARAIDKDSSNVGEVRCYCNQPECVPQGYMCRGRGCFTKLPSNANAPISRAEHTAHSGCLDENLKSRQCPAGFLCCDQDLCNHVDSPAMRNRLNKTLRVLIGDQRAYLAPQLHPNSRGSQTADGWFPTATIIVAICGFIVLLMIASLAVRWLQPMPEQNANKFVPHRTSDNGPPLLGPPKVPLV